MQKPPDPSLKRFIWMPGFGDCSAPIYRLVVLLACAALVLNACAPSAGYSLAASGAVTPTAQPAGVIEPVSAFVAAEVTSTPAFTPRPQYSPGELVDYTVQAGDTLMALAARFNTSIPEIREANPGIPNNTTTLPPGMPMKIPIYFVPLWGTPFQIIPDSLFVNGPAQINFDTAVFVAQYPGWLKNYMGTIYGNPKSGAEIVDQVALDYSISPRLLLALLEYQAQALSNPVLSPELDTYPLGIVNRTQQGLFRQLNGAGDILNNGYYNFRNGKFTELILLNGRIERPDPWQNAATVAFQHYFSRYLPEDAYHQAISQDGIAKVYAALFGDPWGPASAPPHIPGSLLQPEFRLPFEPGRTWAYTGGPHTAWGYGEPLAAIDFAPPSAVEGCAESNEWATAVAAGVIARSESAIVVLDLDGDGDERTGWNVFYLHLSDIWINPVGTMVQAGQPVGHPSCEGGRATGTHVHIARKYNGEWILADSPLPFNMEGWVAHNGPTAYQGTLMRFSETVTACTCSDYRSHIHSEKTP